MKKEPQMVPSSVTNYSNQELYELIIGNSLFSLPFLPSEKWKPKRMEQRILNP